MSLHGWYNGTLSTVLQYEAIISNNLSTMLICLYPSEINVIIVLTILHSNATGKPIVRNQMLRGGRGRKKLKKHKKKKRKNRRKLNGVLTVDNFLCALV